MRTGKYQKQRKSMKSMALVLVLVLLLGCGIGGTLAWLLDTTDPVTNTFTVGNIDIDLKEHDLINNNLDMNTEVTEEDTYKIIPGTSQPKDPFVRVEAGSEACWVFVQVQELNNVAATDENGVTSHKYVTWEIDGTVWTKLSEIDGIITYYAATSYTTQQADKTYNVLKDTKVSYGDSLTKEMIDKLYDADGTIKTDARPQLIFKAFAVQAEAAADVTAAWTQVPASEKLG